MKRREWLYYLGVTGVGGAVGWRFLNAPRTLTLPDLRKTLTTAEAFQRPVLVFVIPEDAAEFWQQGVALGAFLNGADDETLARLALTEIVCAPVYEVGELEIRFTSPIGRQPMLVLIGPEVDEQGRLLVASLGAKDVVSNATDSASASAVVASNVDPDEERVHRQNDRIARFLAWQLSNSRVRELAELVKKHCDPVELAGLLLTGSEHEKQLVTVTVLHCQWAGVDLEALQIEGDAQQQLTELGRSRYVKVRPEGALWTRSGGCASAIYEGIEYREDNSGIMCGMGFSTPLESRFLTFLTEENIDHFQ